MTPLDRARTRLFHLAFRFLRPMTLGVRIVAEDGMGGVFLVRHTYTAGWHLPGGGVEAGQTLEEAARRELREEGNLAIEGAPRLHGVFFNDRFSRRDHVAVYIATRVVSFGPRPPDREIAEAGFFPRAALPEGTTAATRARLAEIFEGAPVSPKW